jgi:hypothetical protein
MDCRKDFGRSCGRKLRHLPQLEMRYVRSPPFPYRTARLYTFRARDRRTDGESSSSTLVAVSAALRRRRSGRKSETGGCGVARTSRSTIWPGCSTPSYGTGSTTVIVTSSRLFIRRSATSTGALRTGRWRNTNACGGINHRPYRPAVLCTKSVRYV